MQVALIACFARFFLTFEMLWAESKSGLHAPVMAARIARCTAILTQACNSCPLPPTAQVPTSSTRPSQPNSPIPASAVLLRTADADESATQSVPTQPAHQPVAAMLSASQLPLCPSSAVLPPSQVHTSTSRPGTAFPIAQTPAVTLSMSTDPTATKDSIKLPHSSAAAPPASATPKSKPEPKPNPKHGCNPYHEMYTLGAELQFN